MVAFVISCWAIVGQQLVRPQGGADKVQPERQLAGAPDKRIELRIGIHVGDIIIEEGDIFGDGVNIAARLEAIAEPGGICISDDAYRQVRDKLNIVFEDAGEQQLKNIARSVRVYRVKLGEGDATQPTAPALALPDKSSIAVLPFQNMSGDSDQDYFCDGRVRITGQLIDAVTGAHVWAERYDRRLEDIFALQDEITLNVVGAIEPSLRQAEIERVKRERPESLGAYDLLLRALPDIYAADATNTWNCCRKH